MHCVDMLGTAFTLPCFSHSQVKHLLLQVTQSVTTGNWEEKALLCSLLKMAWGIVLSRYLSPWTDWKECPDKGLNLEV